MRKPLPSVPRRPARKSRPPREDAEETYALLSRWASLLGWQGLRRHQHKVRNSGNAQSDGLVIRWFESGLQADVCLQINENPPWHAAVYAMRYRIVTGWHKFHLHHGLHKLKAEADRLKTFLDHDWFASMRRRREFRSIHPECAGWTWKRIRREGPPHQYVLSPLKKGTRSRS